MWSSPLKAKLQGRCIPTQVLQALSSKEKREQWGLRSSLSPPPSISRPSTPTPPSRTCSPLPLSRTCSPLPLSRTSSPLPPPLPVLSTAPAPGPPPPPPLPPTHLAAAPPPPPPPGPSRIRESPGDEDTTALLPRSDTLLQLSEDDGTENPLLTPLLSPPPPRRSPRRSPLPLSPVDLDLDESHVWEKWRMDVFSIQMLYKTQKVKFLVLLKVLNSLKGQDCFDFTSPKWRKLLPLSEIWQIRVTLLSSLSSDWGLNVCYSSNRHNVSSLILTKSRNVFSATISNTYLR